MGDYLAREEETMELGGVRWVGRGMRIRGWSPQHHDFKFARDSLLILVLGSEFPSSLSQM